MLEQLIINLRPFVKYFELGAGLIGLLYSTKWKKSPFIILPFYLIAISCSEFFGAWLRDTGRTNYYYSLYKYFVLILEFITPVFIYLRSGLLSKKWLGTIAAIFFLAWLAEVIFLTNSKLPFTSFSYSVGNILLSIIIFMYFRQLISGNQLLAFKRDPYFWYATGLLIFYLGSFPFYLLFNTLAIKFYKDIYLPYNLIVIFLNLTMYTLFSAMFIWTKPKS